MLAFSKVKDNFWTLPFLTLRKRHTFTGLGKILKGVSDTYEIFLYLGRLQGSSGIPIR
jgi:hypothetical protein